MPTIYAVIPAYKEEDTIAEVVEEVSKHVDKVFVVDDGSRDKTPSIAEEAGATVLRHRINRGVGAAQRTGYRAALRDGCDYVVQIDADGQHKAENIPLILDKAINEKADIVIGSRFLNDSHKNYSFTRRVGIKFFSKLVSMFGELEVTDVTSGFRVYSRNALDKLERLPDRNWAVEQTLEAAIKRFKIVEVSVKMPARKSGKSQFDLGTFIKYPLRAVESVLRIAIYRRS